MSKCENEMKLTHLEMVIDAVKNRVTLAPCMPAGVQVYCKQSNGVIVTKMTCGDNVPD